MECPVCHVEFKPRCPMCHTDPTATFGREGGRKSRRTLTSEQAKAMRAARTAKEAQAKQPTIE